MLIARRDQEAKSIPKMRDVKEISESHKFEHGLASPFVLSVHISTDVPYRRIKKHLPIIRKYFLKQATVLSVLIVHLLEVENNDRD
jgi:hypothetical protein